MAEQKKHTKALKAKADKKFDAKRPAPVSVRLSNEQLKKLDELRQEESRSGYMIRKAELD